MSKIQRSPDDPLRVGLVLTRIKDQQIMIGDDIKITITDVRQGSVRIGILAPPTVAVHRKEVYDMLKIGFPMDVAKLAGKIQVKP